jgi:maltose O-acetyltransferase
VPTEWQKMIAGDMYDPLDPELVAARWRARDLCQELNATREAEEAERRRILRDLFGKGPLHPFNAEQRRREEFGKAIDIGSDVWVGGGAIILAGVRIGTRAVIGAGSVVTRDVPDDVFAAGNPCRVIRAIGD